MNPKKIPIRVQVDTLSERIDRVEAVAYTALDRTGALRAALRERQPGTAVHTHATAGPGDGRPASVPWSEGIVADRARPDGRPREMEESRDTEDGQNSQGLSR